MDKTRKPYPVRARERIQTGMIISRLQKHMNGELEMSGTQIQAARILLSKALPDLQAVEHSGNIDSKAARTMTDNELDRAIEAARQRLSGIVAGKEKAKAGKKQRRSLH